MFGGLVGAQAGPHGLVQDPVVDEVVEVVVETVPAGGAGLGVQLGGDRGHRPLVGGFVFGGHGRGDPGAGFVSQSGGFGVPIQAGLQDAAGGFGDAGVLDPDHPTPAGDRGGRGRLTRGR